MKQVLLKVTNTILKCNKCKKYSMERFCECGEECLSIKPAKYSPIDKYSKYRLDYKKKFLDIK